MYRSGHTSHGTQNHKISSSTPSPANTSTGRSSAIHPPPPGGLKWIAANSSGASHWPSISGTPTCGVSQLFSPLVSVSPVGSFSFTITCMLRPASDARSAHGDANVACTLFLSVVRVIVKILFNPSKSDAM